MMIHPGNALAEEHRAACSKLRFPRRYTVVGLDAASDAAKRGIPPCKCTTILLQRVEIAGRRESEGDIEKAAPFRGRSAHQRDIAWRYDDRGK
jgi:hypothetical protein